MKIKLAWVHLNGDAPTYTFDWVDNKWFHSEKGFTVQGEEEPRLAGKKLNGDNLGDFASFIMNRTFDENTLFDWNWLKQMFTEFKIKGEFNNEI